VDVSGSGTAGAGSPDLRRATAAQLRTTARAHAAAAVEVLLESTPGVAERVAGNAFQIWQAFLAQRVAELATAVEFGEPSLFSAQIGWLHSTLRARSIEQSDVDASIECLAAAMEEDLPPASAGLAVSVLEEARARLGACEREPVRLGAHGEHATLPVRVLELALEGGTAEAVDTVLSALESKSAAVVLEEVLMPVQAELGVMWELGEIGVYEEHAATDVVRTAMAVVWQACRSGEAIGPPVLVGASSGDQHDIGARVTAHLLDLGGRRAVCLGADLPSEEFVRASEAFGSGDFVLSAAMAHHLTSVRSTIEAIRGAVEGARILLGGPAFRGDSAFLARMTEKLGADRIVSRPSEAVGVFAGS
jgi:methanogenic corrinoid protein MtbC1